MPFSHLVVLCTSRWPLAVGDSWKVLVMWNYGTCRLNLCSAAWHIHIYLLHSAVRQIAGTRWHFPSTRMSFHWLHINNHSTFSDVYSMKVKWHKYNRSTICVHISVVVAKYDCNAFVASTMWGIVVTNDLQLSHGSASKSGYIVQSELIRPCPETKISVWIITGQLLIVIIKKYIFGSRSSNSNKLTSHFWPITTHNCQLGDQLHRKRSWFLLSAGHTQRVQLVSVKICQQ